MNKGILTLLLLCFQLAAFSDANHLEGVHYYVVDNADQGADLLIKAFEGHDSTLCDKGYGISKQVPLVGNKVQKVCETLTCKTSDSDYIKSHQPDIKYSSDDSVKTSVSLQASEAKVTISSCYMLKKDHDKLPKAETEQDKARKKIEESKQKIEEATNDPSLTKLQKKKIYKEEKKKLENISKQFPGDKKIQDSVKESISIYDDKLNPVTVVDVTGDSATSGGALVGGATVSESTTTSDGAVVVDSNTSATTSAKKTVSKTPLDYKEPSDKYCGDNIKCNEESCRLVKVSDQTKSNVRQKRRVIVEKGKYKREWIVICPGVKDGDWYDYCLGKENCDLADILINDRVTSKECEDAGNGKLRCENDEEIDIDLEGIGGSCIPAGYVANSGQCCAGSKKVKDHVSGKIVCLESGGADISIEGGGGSHSRGGKCRVVSQGGASSVYHCPESCRVSYKGKSFLWGIFNKKKDLLYKEKGCIKIKRIRATGELEVKVKRRCAGLFNVEVDGDEVIVTDLRKQRRSKPRYDDEDYDWDRDRESGRCDYDDCDYVIRNGNKCYYDADDEDGWRRSCLKGDYDKITSKHGDILHCIHCDGSRGNTYVDGGLGAWGRSAGGILSGIGSIVGGVAPGLFGYLGVRANAKAYMHGVDACKAVQQSHVGALQGITDAQLQYNLDQQTNAYNYAQTNESMIPGYDTASLQFPNAPQCNGYGAGSFAGLGGMYGGIGGVGNPLLGAGYNQAYLNGMLGPYGAYNPYGMTGAGAMFNIPGISIGGGYPGYAGGVYGPGAGIGIGLNGGMYPGAGIGIGLNGGMYPGAGIGIGLNGGMYPGYTGGLYGPGGSLNTGAGLYLNGGQNGLVPWNSQGGSYWNGGAGFNSGFKNGFNNGYNNWAAISQSYNSNAQANAAGSYYQQAALANQYQNAGNNLFSYQSQTNMGYNPMYSPMNGYSQFNGGINLQIPSFQIGAGVNTGFNSGSNIYGWGP